MLVFLFIGNDGWMCVDLQKRLLLVSKLNFIYSCFSFLSCHEFGEAQALPALLCYGE